MRPDSNFTIAAVTASYLKATLTRREEVIGRALFEVFPDNPADPNPTGVRNLKASLLRALRTKAPDAMAIQKYDVRGDSAEFIERFWSPLNTPVLGPDGDVVYLIHRVEDVTEFMQLRIARELEQERTQSLAAQNHDLAAELFARGQELQRINMALDETAQSLELERSLQSCVARLAQDALAGMKVRELMKRAAEDIAANLRVDFARVTEYVSGEQALTICAGAGFPADIVGEQVCMWDRSLTGYAMQQNVPIVLHDADTETRFEIPPLLKKHQVKSAIAIAIPGTMRTYGVLTACSKTKREFQRTEIHFLEALANVLATVSELQSARRSQRLLLERFINVQEEERRRIARELHDESGQALTSLLLGLGVIENSESSAETRSLASRLIRIATDTLDNLGRLARGLHPWTLDQFGLVAALEAYIEGIKSVQVQLMPGSLRGERLESAAEITLYRIAQEALTNIARHSGAQHAWVRLVRTDTSIIMSVRDDGRGLPTADRGCTAQGTRSHLGLQSMEERAAMIGGRFSLRSREGRGTIIKVSVPTRSDRTT